MAQEQPHGCSGASEATLKYMGKSTVVISWQIKKEWKNEIK